MLRALRAAVADPTQVRTRALDLHANAHDASHFLLIPQAVVVAGNADEVGRLLRASAAQGVPLTFRSGGTSLSGQALTDGVLVDVRRNFKGIEVLDDGARVRVQPGVTVRALNARLAPYGRKFGPDPASEGACTIGGVVANNSSGMACGTVDNTYKTLESLTVVLPSGTVVDTGAPDADERLRTLEPELHEGLLRLSRRVRGNPDSVATIQHQFSMKNTMGYGVNSLLDFERPADILAHLIVGSEGTLGFVADAVFRTIPRLAHVTTALLVFADLEAANTALPALVETGAATLELMDALSLKVGQTLPGTPPVILELSVRDHAALLVEYHADSVERLAELQHVGIDLVDRLPLSAPTTFSADSVTRAQLWHLRKGLYAAVAGARRLGTTALLEDVVVPVPALGRTCIELIKLFDKYSYRNSVIFGHAKDGNIHFMLTDGFSAKDELDRYSAFTEDMVDVVLGEGGSLKAEHGTGRVMAPYVRRQYGDELYDVMREVKLLFDPAGMLNPGVLMNDDPKAHLRHIKTAPPVAEEVDRCVSCGYCEPVCPSRNITLTPRQRIVTLRAIEQAKARRRPRLGRRAREGLRVRRRPDLRGGRPVPDGLPREHQHRDAGQAVPPAQRRPGGQRGLGHRGEALEAPSPAAPVTRWTWSARSRSASCSHRTSSRGPCSGPTPCPSTRPSSPAAAAPASARRRPASRRRCTSRPASGRCSARPSTPRPASRRASSCSANAPGITLLVPPGIDKLCCGTPWSSKGLVAGQATMNRKTLAALRVATRDGELPIVCDASSCTEGLRHTIETDPSEKPMTVIDSVEFALTHILPKLPDHAKLESLALHPTCSSTRMGINASLEEVARGVAERVQIPENWGCCAFAGDRGMLHPELTASATQAEAADVAAMGATAHASCNRTCELGMTRATGEPYRHVLELLEEITRPSTPETTAVRNPGNRGAAAPGLR